MDIVKADASAVLFCRVCLDVCVVFTLQQRKTCSLLCLALCSELRANSS